MTQVLSPFARPQPGMTWIEGGAGVIGSNHHYPEERPVRKVEVEGFWINTQPVTNAAFADFVATTGWVTVAEIAPNPEDYPGAQPDMLAPASLVFEQPDRAVDLADISNWWRYVPGADWRHPYGPESSLAGLMDHPVTHVAWADVEAYLAWSGMDLPTEAEWEYAARGGLADAEYAWGPDFTPEGRHMANTWQGDFPYQNDGLDGWARTSPVGSFPANGYGLYDMIGNVWEWTKDDWSVHADGGISHCCGRASRGYSPQAQAGIPRKVLKGGSHLCAPNYCRRYRPAARHAHPVDTSTSHIGFRGVTRP